jgi:hypothetical protein
LSLIESQRTAPTRIASSTHRITRRLRRGGGIFIGGDGVAAFAVMLAC